MPFVPASRNRPTPLDAVVVLLVLTFAALIFWMFRPNTAGPLTATLSLDGQVVETFVLEDIDDTIIYEVPNVPYEISLIFERGRVRVDHSHCPGQDCVHVGWISRAGSQLVCLPNRMLLTLSGGDDSDGVDFMLQ